MKKHSNRLDTVEKNQAQKDENNIRGDRNLLVGICGPSELGNDGVA